MNSRIARWRSVRSSFGLAAIRAPSNRCLVRPYRTGALMANTCSNTGLTPEQVFHQTANRRSEYGQDRGARRMAAIQIDSPRWRDGWGEPIAAPAPRPALRL